jgi:16S rRNA (cytidine1402-2'-O)-methyltransferase
VSATLFIVATPIGNLEDLSPRVRRTLSEVKLIAAEDTRRTGRLLSHIGVGTPLTALHEHNESDAVSGLLERLAAGESLALVCDAGTPLISDPGYRLVAAARERGVTITPVPGPSALTAALSVAGLPTDRFCFEGFLPAKSAARRATLEALAHETRTLVFYEAVHRIRAMIDDLAEAFGGERPAFIGRELTKLHEQLANGTLAELAARLHAGDIPEKGEFVVIVHGGAPAGAGLDADALARELAAVLPMRQAAAVTAKLAGGRANEIYRRLLDKK